MTTSFPRSIPPPVLFHSYLTKQIDTGRGLGLGGTGWKIKEEEGGVHTPFFGFWGIDEKKQFDKYFFIV
jgi:hypothetical protein